MFAQFKDPVTEEVSADQIQYTDPVTGFVWTVPEGHRIWNDIYLPWLAAGNTPTAAD